MKLSNLTNDSNVNESDQECTRHYKTHVSIQHDFEKIYNKGNIAAGVRVRKGMQEMKKVAQEVRIEIQKKKNSHQTQIPYLGINAFLSLGNISTLS